MKKNKDISLEKNDFILLILILVIFSVAFGPSFYQNIKKADQKNESNQVNIEENGKSIGNQEFCEIDNLDCLFVGCNSYF